MCSKKTSDGSGGGGDKKFVVMIQTDHKDHYDIIDFIQWDGNESTLTELSTILDKHYQYQIGDNCSTTVNIKNLVSETTVNEMCTVSLGSGGCPRKFTGKLKPVIFDIYDGMDEEEIIWEFYKKLAGGGDRLTFM